MSKEVVLDGIIHLDRAAADADTALAGLRAEYEQNSRARWSLALKSFAVVYPERWEELVPYCDFLLNYHSKSNTITADMMADMGKLTVDGVTDAQIGQQYEISAAMVKRVKYQLVWSVRELLRETGEFETFRGKLAEIVAPEVAACYDFTSQVPDCIPGDESTAIIRNLRGLPQLIAADRQLAEALQREPHVSIVVRQLAAGKDITEIGEAYGVELDGNPARWAVRRFALGKDTQYIRKLSLGLVQRRFQEGKFISDEAEEPSVGTQLGAVAGVVFSLTPPELIAAAASAGIEITRQDVDNARTFFKLLYIQAQRDYTDELLRKVLTGGELNQHFQDRLAVYFTSDKAWISQAAALSAGSLSELMAFKTTWESEQGALWPWQSEKHLDSICIFGKKIIHNVTLGRLSLLRYTDRNTWNTAARVFISREAGTEQILHQLRVRFRSAPEPEPLTSGDWIGELRRDAETEDRIRYGLGQLPVILRYTALTGFSFAGQALPREFISDLASGASPEQNYQVNGEMPSQADRQRILAAWESLLLGVKRSDPYTMEQIFTQHMYALSLKYFRQNRYSRDVVPLPNTSVHDTFSVLCRELYTQDAASLARQYVQPNDRKPATKVLRDVRKFIEKYGHDVSTVVTVLQKGAETAERDMFHSVYRVVISVVNGAQDWSEAVALIGDNSPEQLLRRLRMQLMYAHAGDSRYLVRATQLGLYEQGSSSPGSEITAGVVFQFPGAQTPEPEVLPQTEQMQPSEAEIEPVSAVIEPQDSVTYSPTQISMFLKCMDTDYQITQDEVETVLSGTHPSVRQAREYMSILSIMHNGDGMAMRRVMLKRLAIHFKDTNGETDIFPLFLAFAAQIGIYV